MNLALALHTTAEALGGQRVGLSGTVYRFESLQAADHAHQVLNGLNPGCTGEVVGAGELALMPVLA